MILGGAKAQLQLIQAARNEGNFVVLCDYTDTNTGISISDKHYKVNYMDTDDEIPLYYPVYISIIKQKISKTI